MKENGSEVFYEILGTENMTVSGKCQFDEDGKVSFIELDTNELEMTLIANDNADPTQKPPANGNAITLNE